MPLNLLARCAKLFSGCFFPICTRSPLCTSSLLSVCTLPLALFSRTPSFSLSSSTPPLFFYFLKSVLLSFFSPICLLRCSLLSAIRTLFPCLFSFSYFFFNLPPSLFCPLSNPETSKSDSPPKPDAFISAGNKALNAVKEIYQNLVFFHLCFYFSINVSYCSVFCHLELLLNSKGAAIARVWWVRRAS